MSAHDSRNDARRRARGTTASVMLLGAALAASSQNGSAEVYKWVDESGVVQFSERKPEPVRDVETIDVEKIEPSRPTMVCGGDAGLQATKVLAMTLAKPFRDQVPGYVDEHADAFREIHVYACINGIFDDIHKMVEVTKTPGPGPERSALLALESLNVLAVYEALSQGRKRLWRGLVRRLESRDEEPGFVAEDVAALIETHAARARERYQWQRVEDTALFDRRLQAVAQQFDFD